MAAISRLSAEQQATEVHCRLLHDGAVALDRALPWSAVAIETQAGVHLPANVEQLRGPRS